VFLDKRRGRAYISCCAGVEAVLERDATEWRRLDVMQTATGSRTSLFVSEIDRLFVGQWAGLLKGDAAIRVYRPSS
jgi:hypothetical protein